MTFIDDFSRKIWVYFLKNNLDTFSNFEEFKALIENKSSKFIKLLRLDGGDEYDSHEFTYFSKHHGI